MSNTQLIKFNGLGCEQVQEGSWAEPDVINIRGSGQSEEGRPPQIEFIFSFTATTYSLFYSL